MNFYFLVLFIYFFLDTYSMAESLSWFKMEHYFGSVTVWPPLQVVQSLPASNRTTLNESLKIKTIQEHGSQLSCQSSLNFWRPQFVRFPSHLILTQPSKVCRSRGSKDGRGFSIEEPGCTIPTMNIQQRCSAVSAILHVSRTMRDDRIAS